MKEFLKHLDTFPAFEESVHGLIDRMAVGFLGLALTNADTLIRERLTAAAEAKLLNEAEAHSCQHAAESRGQRAGSPGNQRLYGYTGISG